MNQDFIHTNKIGSDRLLICAGDSWTWGDSLGSKLHFITEEQRLEHRTSHLYGRLLSKKMNSDFINVARRGGWNIQIHDMLAEVLSEIVSQNQYKEINVIVCLTEICRESWGDPLWVPDESQDLPSFDDFLYQYEQNMFMSFKNNFVDKYTDINFYFGRNFTESYDTNILKNNFLDKSWCQCLEAGTPYPEEVRMLSSIAITPLIKRLKKLNLYKKYRYSMLEMFANSELAMDWLDQSRYNYQIATRHPTEEGHEIYAEYLSQRLK